MESAFPALESLLLTDEEIAEPEFENGKLKLELESAKLNNCVVYGDFKDASGGFCIGKMDFEDSTAELTFDVPEAGRYKVTVVYTAGYGDASGLVRVGQGNEREIVYKTTGEWNVFADTSFVEDLAQGTNTIRFRKSNGYASLDYVVIEKVASSVSIPQHYEAEDATLNNCEAYKDFKYASNGLCAGKIDYNDSYVEFKVNVATKGSYRMGIRYSTGYDSTPTMLIGVNGGEGVSQQLPRMGAWDEWFTIYTTVELEAGENIIRIQRGSGYAAIDYITLLLEGVDSGMEEIEIQLPTVGDPFADSASPTVPAETTPPATQPQKPNQTPSEVEPDSTWFRVLMVVACGLCVVGTVALYVVAFARNKKRGRSV